MLNNIFKNISEILYPAGPYCCFCNSMLKIWEIYWCNSCINKIKKERNNYKHCQKCARFVLNNVGLCNYCTNNSYPFSDAVSAGMYSGILKDALHEFKYRNKQIIAEPLARLAALEALNYKKYLMADIIIAVPMHIVKLKKRGYNQSELLAKSISEIFKIPFRKNILIKTKNTVDMVSLSRNERLNNLKGAFSVDNHQWIVNQRIILVDDIFTTGSTVSSCSETLLNAGAKEVLVLTAASSFDK
jgi:ComF family protein